MDLLVHPVLESLAQDGVHHIGEVATTEFANLFTWRKGELDVPIPTSELEDGVDGEALELWHVDELHGITVDDPLDTHGQVPQMPDGDCFIAGEVGLDLGGEEPVDLYRKHKINTSSGQEAKARTYLSYSGTWQQTMLLRSAPMAVAHLVMGWRPSFSSGKVVVNNDYQNSKNLGNIF